MTTYSDNSFRLDGQSAQQDNEIQLFSRLSEMVRHVGINFDRTVIANFYISLKSKPLTILTGPIQSGKVELVSCLAHTLMGCDCQQYQMMVGHPWSFGNTKNLALFTEAHMRFNTEKLLGLVEEAWRLENAQRVFLACITHISPAELLSFFTEVSYQLQHGQLMRLGDVHFIEPVPFPPNLFLIGTMDTDHFDWWDNDLLLNTIIIQTTESTFSPYTRPMNPAFSEEREFLRSCVRKRQAVYHKIHTILRWEKQPLTPLMQIAALLREQAGLVLDWLVNETIVYLANSWTKQGNGLFAPSIPDNLAISLDLAISQIFLPGAADAIRRKDILREQFHNVLFGVFPRSAAFINTLAA